MSEIEVRDTETTVVEAVAPPMTGDLSELAQWAADARQVAAVAVSLARTSFVPEAYRNKPAEVTAAILAGHEVGMQPIAALRSINIIQGTPSMSAMAMRGLVQSRGHKVRVVEVSPTRAVAHGRRAGEDEVHESVWTIERAKEAGLTGKSNWSKQPQAMLAARATAECCRLTAADVLLGIPYSTEELVDLGEQDPSPRRAKLREESLKRKTAQRKPIPEPELTAELGEPVTAEEELPELTGDRDE